MERVYPIQKADVVYCLETGCRVYYIEKGSTEIYEFTEQESLSELKNAEYFIAVKNG